MYCFKCGKEIEQNSTFCAHCGADQSAANKPANEAAQTSVEETPNVVQQNVEAQDVQESAAAPSPTQPAAAQSGEVVNAAQSGQVASGEVQSGQVASGAVQSGQVASGAVQSGQAASGEVQSGEVVVPAQPEQPSNKKKAKKVKKAKKAKASGGKGKGGKIIALIVIIVVVAIIGVGVKFALDFFTGGGLSFGKSNKTDLYSADGETYIIKNGDPVSIFEEAIGYSNPVETDEYILYSAGDKIYVYDKKKEDTLDVDDVKKAILSPSRKEMLMLVDDEVQYGKVTDLEDLEGIAKDVVDFDAFADLKTIFVLNDENELKTINEKGDEQDFEVDDVFGIAASEDRYLAYLTEEDLILYDYKDEDELDKKEFEGMYLSEGEFLPLNAIGLGENRGFMITDQYQENCYYVSPEDNELDEYDDFTSIMRSGDGSGEKYYLAGNYTDSHYHSSFFDNGKHEVVVIATMSNDYYVTEDGVEKMKEYDGISITDEKLYTLEDEELVAHSREDYEEEYAADLDLDKKEEVMGIIAVAKDKVYAFTDERILLCEKKKVHEIDFEFDDIAKGDFSRPRFQRGAGGYSKVYMFDDDAAYYLDNKNVKQIYDGEDIERVFTVGTFDQAVVAMLNEDEELYLLKDGKCKKIAEEVDEYSLNSDGLIYEADKDQFILQRDGKIIKLKDDLL